MSGDNEIQSVMRALRVLEALNQQSVCSVETLHNLTALPKPTLIRMLGTLVKTGYVFHVSRRDGYALTEKVLRLSAGFSQYDAIVDVARPLLEEFTAANKWQLSIATLDTDAMRVRFNTRHLSPFAPDQRWLNRRVGMLESAIGRAYLAWCPEVERQSILNALQAADPALWRGPGRRRWVEDLLETVRIRGYATIEREPGNRVRSFAIPVIDPVSRGAIASLALFYFASAMTERQATARYLEVVCEIGRRIVDGLDRSRAGEVLSRAS